jgi:hypothetical protein
MEISADPSKAEAGMDRLRAASEAGAHGLAIDAGNMQRALIGPRESVRLLSQDLGIHLPRAVTGAIGQMLPEIAGLGTALMGAFAVEEMVKYFGWVNKTADAINEVAQSQKAIKIIADENLSNMEAMAKKSIDYARSQIALLNVQALAGERAVEALKQHQEGMDEALPAMIPVMSAYHALVGESKDLKDAEAGLSKIYQMRDALIKVLGEDEHEAHDKAARAAQAHAKAEERLVQFIDKERIKGAHEIVKLLEEQQKQEIKEAEVEERLAKIRAQGMADFERYTMDETNYHATLLTLVPPITELTTKTVHLSAARKELTGVTQSVHEVEDAFAKALHGETEALVSMTASAAGIGEQVAALIGGKRAEAEVRGAFDIAMSIEEMAHFIASWGTDTAALMASVQYGLAGAEMFKVAGRGGGRGAGGGAYGGGASARMASYGGGGPGSGRGGEVGGGGGPGAGAGAGAGFHLTINGNMMTDKNSTQQFFDEWSQAIQGGTMWLSSSTATIQGPTATGRG